MPAPRKLSDNFIANHKHAKPGQRIETNDLGTKLRLRVTDKLKSFYWCGRLPGAASSVRLHLGNYSAMSLAEARKKVAAWDELVERGIDPRTELRREREAEEAKAHAKAMAVKNVFAVRMSEYLDDHCKHHRQARETGRLMRKELLPLWGDRVIDTITPTEIKDVIRAIAKRSPSTARNVLTLCKSFFDWTLEERSPAAAISPKRVIGVKEPRQHLMSDDDVRAFWKATEHLGVPYRQFYRFLLLTGVRLREAANATWDEIDGNIFTVPAERFKSNCTHKVPLTDAVMQLLDELPRRGRFVFSVTGTSPINGFSKSKARLDQLMGVSDWRVHDLRRVVRSGLASLKVPDMVAEMVIGHGKRGLQRVYDQHEYADEMREALALWAGRVRDITEPSPINVVKLKRGRK